MKQQKVITYSNLRSFAYSNDKICKTPISGIVISFGGLGFCDMLWEDNDVAKAFAQKGIIYLVPYMNPWAWMNRQTVSFTDELIDVVCKQYNLPSNVPIVSSGGSMGGQQALTYMVYAKITPVACIVNCPVCDLLYHYTERVDLPRTMYSAFGGENVDLEQAIKDASPMHLTDKLPQANYYVFHCQKDSAVNIALHSEAFVNKIKGSHNVVFHVVPDREHCALTEEMQQLYYSYIEQNILRK